MGKIVPLSFFFIAVGSSISLAQPPIQKPTPPSEATQITVRANNAFACELFRVSAKAKPGENAFLSPWSISSALAMTMEGARNDTAAANTPVILRRRRRRRDRGTHA